MRWTNSTEANCHRNGLLKCELAIASGVTIWSQCHSQVLVGGLFLGGLCCKLGETGAVLWLGAQPDSMGGEPGVCSSDADATSKAAWLMQIRQQWESAHHARHRLRDDAGRPHVDECLSDAALKRLWLSRRRNEHKGYLAQRNNLDRRVGPPPPLVDAAVLSRCSPTKRELYLQQRQQERDLALRERRWRESEAARRPPAPDHLCCASPRSCAVALTATGGKPSAPSRPQLSSRTLAGWLDGEAGSTPVPSTSGTSSSGASCSGASRLEAEATEELEQLEAMRLRERRLGSHWRELHSCSSPLSHATEAGVAWEVTPPRERSGSISSLSSGSSKSSPLPYRPLSAHRAIAPAPASVFPSRRLPSAARKEPPGTLSLSRLRGAMGGRSRAKVATIGDPMFAPAVDDSPTTAPRSQGSARGSADAGIGAGGSGGGAGSMPMANAEPRDARRAAGEGAPCASSAAIGHSWAWPASPAPPRTLSPALARVPIVWTTEEHTAADTADAAHHPWRERVPSPSSETHASSARFSSARASSQAWSEAGSEAWSEAPSSAASARACDATGAGGLVAPPAAAPTHTACASASSMPYACSCSGAKARGEVLRLDEITVIRRR